MPGADPTLDDTRRLSDRLAALPGVEELRVAAAGLAAYLVGGAVRDLLLGGTRADLDVVVEGDHLGLVRGLGGTVRTHDRFGTATVSLEGLTVDVARARSESYARPGALPEVRAATLAEDLARRDFSINAMALPLSPPLELIDPHGGLADLRAGSIRVLHAGSFTDDPTRALRAARYAARYGFDLEDETERLVRTADLRTVSRDRVEAELRKIAAEPRAAQAFALIAEWGILPLPGRLPALVTAIDDAGSGPGWPVVASRADAVLAAALGDGVDEARSLAARAPERPSEIAVLARGHRGTTLLMARALGAEWLDVYVERLRHVRLEIHGGDLMREGIPEGPAVGRGLETALRAKLDGEVAGRDEELALALAAAREAA